MIREQPRKRGKAKLAAEGPNASVSFIVGLRHVCEGLDKGVLGMRVGGKRNLTVPASLNTLPIAGLDTVVGVPVRLEMSLVRAK